MKLEWKQILIAAFAGWVIGAAVGWSAFQYQYRDLLRDGDRYSQMLERFSAKLGLSPEQKTKIQELLESKRQKIKVLRAEVHPKFEEIRNATREEIRQLLTAEQQEKFDAMQSDWESYWKRRR